MRKKFIFAGLELFILARSLRKFRFRSGSVTASGLLCDNTRDLKPDPDQKLILKYGAEFGHVSGSLWICIWLCTTAAH
jgi:hypothetical protein